MMTLVVSMMVLQSLKIQHLLQHHLVAQKQDQPSLLLIQNLSQLKIVTDLITMSLNILKNITKKIWVQIEM